MGLFKKPTTILLLLLAICLSASGQHNNADVQHYNISLTLHDGTDKVNAVTSVTVRFLQDVNSLHLDLVGRSTNDTGMLISAVTEGKKRLAFRQDRGGVYLTLRAKKGESHTYTIAYAGIPADGLIISRNKFGKRTFFTDNWPNRAHHWLPSVDHPADKAAVDFNIVAPDHYTVVANGVKTEETQLPGRLKRTRYTEKVPLPTKVIAVGVADFAVHHSADVQGIPVYSYVFPENKEKGFQDYATAGEILAFFIDKLGPYPYKKLANIQSKTIYGGMENASAIFYAEESVGSRHIEELLAHEIAHQWFGDGITETSWEHVWLSEGFATYMTHLYMENKYGSDTLMAALETDRRKVISFSTHRHTPVVDTSARYDYTQLLNANSYQKGGWVLHMLRRQVGDTTFWKGIRTYFAAYNGRNANTSDFKTIMEAASGEDLTIFFQQWLYTPQLPQLVVDRVTGKDGQSTVFTIRQLQQPFFTFPLEYTVDGDTTIHKIMIRDGATPVTVPGVNDTVHIRLDPHVNLLFTPGKNEQ
jgi:aminopeptidase N